MPLALSVPKSRGFGKTLRRHSNKVVADIVPMPASCLGGCALRREDVFIRRSWERSAQELSAPVLPALGRFKLRQNKVFKKKKTPKNQAEIYQANSK